MHTHMHDVTHCIYNTQDSAYTYIGTNCKDSGVVTVSLVYCNSPFWEVLLIQNLQTVYSGSLDLMGGQMGK